MVATVGDIELLQNNILKKVVGKIFPFLVNNSCLKGQEVSQVIMFEP